MKSGDEFFTGPNVRIDAKDIELGDYAKIHQDSWIFGKDKCRIGHNFWLGQGSVLNCDAPLIIGNNVRIGLGSRVWTHASAGELLEGCQIHNFEPVIIENDAWFMSDVTISPGVTIAEKSVIMPRAVVTKNTEKNAIYGGIPARKLGGVPFITPSIHEKLTIMEQFVQDFMLTRGGSEITWNSYEKEFWSNEPSGFIKVSYVGDWPRRLPAAIFCARPTKDVLAHEQISVFNLETRQYTKRRTAIEIALMNFLNGYRARFTPMEVII